MRILVTGSQGNIGRKLCSFLVKKGYTVAIYDKVIGKDILNIEQLSDYFTYKKFDVVFHLAAWAGRKRCEEQRDLALKVNVQGTHNICTLCLEYGCKLIYFSTSEVYGDVPRQEEEVELYPVNWYGVTKKMSEEVVQYYGTLGLKYTIVRPFMIYDEDEDMGGYRSAIIRFVVDDLRKIRFKVHKDTERGWLHIDDALRFFALLLDCKVDIINIGNEDVRSMESVARLILKTRGVTEAELNKDFNQGFFYDLVEQPKGMIRSKYPSLSRQQQLLNFQPQITLEEGLKRVIKRVKERLAC